MITYHQFHHIKSLQQHGQSAGQIASQVGISEKTARLWMSREHYQSSRPAKPQTSKLDPCKDRIAELLAQYSSYTAQQIFQKLQEEDNYQGSYTLVKEYLRKIRPRKSQIYDSLIFAPGEVAQVDFGECGLTEVGNTRRKLYVFVMVLGYSRLMFIEFILRQNLECFLSCHRHAFEAIGGGAGRGHRRSSQVCYSRR
jgi:transposase